VVEELVEAEPPSMKEAEMSSLAVRTVLSDAVMRTPSVRPRGQPANTIRKVSSSVAGVQVRTSNDSVFGGMSMAYRRSGDCPPK